MLINYLPPFMQEYREIREICTSEDYEIKELQNYKNKIQKELFLETATDYGIKRTESNLGITASDGESMEYRKFRIKSILIGTHYSLIEALNSLIPNGEYTLNFDINTLTLTLRIPLSNKMYLNSVSEMLDKTVPLNIAVSCSILYTSHSNAGKYTHSELKEFTHKFIKEDLHEQ
ncbi:MAG: DUF2313 domain-containing protein [Clostridia bacterium]|nr:DUF2313 domain-containing protein [Clostridia bacterium]